MMEDMVEAPRIFTYLDYRAFLEDFFAFRKSRDPEFSLRTFARLPGLALSSSSFISAVIKGRKNLSQNLRLSAQSPQLPDRQGVDQKPTGRLAIHLQRQGCSRQEAPSGYVPHRLGDKSH